MFSALTSSLGLSPSAASNLKLAFRTSAATGLKRLLVGPISKDDVGFWAQFYQLFDDAGEVAGALPFSVLRQAREQQPANLQTLLEHLLDHLQALVASDAFPSPAKGRGLGEFLPAAARGKGSEHDTTTEALNCLRVIARIVPILYEVLPTAAPDASAAGGRDEASFAWRVLYAPRAQRAARDGSSADGFVESGGNGPAGGGLQFVIDSDDEDEQTAGPAQGASTSIATDSGSTAPTVSEQLFSLTVDLLFLTGFTVPPSTTEPAEKIAYTIWLPGIGSSTAQPASSPRIDANRVEVLRFLQVLLSRAIYLPPPLLPSTPIGPLATLTSLTPTPGRATLDRRLLLSVLCSLLNTTLTPTSPALINAVPYAHLLKGGMGASLVGIGAEELSGSLRKGCAHVLLAGLDYWADDDGHDNDGKEGNAFRYFISKLHRKDDFAFLWAGVEDVLFNHLTASSGLLPGANKPPPLLLETWLIFWRLIDLNKKFRTWLLSDEQRCSDLAGYVLLNLLERKDDPVQHPTLRLLSYILQTLTAQPSFARALNETTINLNVPIKWKIHGSAADSLIVWICAIATTPGTSPLFPALTISIANIAPYARDLTILASTKFVQLLVAFSNPAFLLRGESHPRLLNYLLEGVNSMIFRQLSHNPNLLYALLGAHQRFAFLATFTLKKGLQDILRVQRAKALAAERAKNPDAKIGIVSNSSGASSRPTFELQRNASTNTLGSLPQEAQSPVDTPPSSPAPVPRQMSEKARGKLREGFEEPGANMLGLHEDEDDGDLNDDLQKLLLGGLGGAGFVPTQEWVTSWQKALPLDPILLTISELLPKVETLQSSSKSQGPNKAVIAFLRSVTLLDVLPPAPALNARPFAFSQSSLIWLTCLLWGETYVAGMSPAALWIGTHVKLFGVKSAPPGRREVALQNVQSAMTSVFRSSSSQSSASSAHPPPPPEPRRQSSTGSTWSGRGGTV